MGTNYYARLNICPTCKRPEEEIHLGKSSMGWKFMFQYNGGQYYKSVPEMKKWLKDKLIFNEYDEQLPNRDFWEMVATKQDTIDPDEMDTVIIDGYKFYDRKFS